jgi:hypothetical protein
MKHNHTLGLSAFAFLLISLTASAQQYPPPVPSAPPPSAPPRFSATDLEKLAVPIAMHPDPLIAIILPASVYPLDIVQAARFVRDTNNLPKVDDQSWDENVKAVARFPELIAMMDADLSWTSDLGQAFLEQPEELMNTIQALRAKAQNLGTLRTTPQQVVVVTNTIIQTTVQQQVIFVTNTVVLVQPANPEVIYVPAYPPSMYYYYPPPIYVGPPPVVTFAAGLTVGLIIANNCDWHHGGIYVGHHGVAVWGGSSYHGHGNVNVNVNRNVNINNNTTINNIDRAPQKWQPDQSRLNTAGAPGSRASTQTAQARGWSSRPASPSLSPSASRPSPSPSIARPSPAPSYSRPTPSPSFSQPSPSVSRASAFGGMGSGASTRQISSRGASSRGGGAGRSFGGRR